MTCVACIRWFTVLLAIRLLRNCHCRRTANIDRRERWRKANLLIISTTVIAVTVFICLMRREPLAILFHRLESLKWMIATTPGTHKGMQWYFDQEKHYYVWYKEVLCMNRGHGESTDVINASWPWYLLVSLIKKICSSKIVSIYSINYASLTRKKELIIDPGESPYAANEIPNKYWWEIWNR